MNSPLLVGFVASFTLIAAIGAQNAFVLRQGIRREHVLPVVALCTVSDIALIAAGIAGVGALINAHPGAVNIAKFGGALFLFGYGLLAARRAWRPSTPDSVGGDAGPTGRGAGDCRRTDVPQPACLSRHRRAARRAGQRASRRSLAVRHRRRHRQRGLVRQPRPRCATTGRLVRHADDMAHPRRADRRDDDRPRRRDVVA